LLGEIVSMQKARAQRDDRHHAQIAQFPNQCRDFAEQADLVCDELDKDVRCWIKRCLCSPTR
jgi:hypothetical protein